MLAAMHSKTLATLALLTGFTWSQKVKFMPLGDSITEITCWRARLWDLFAENELLDEVDFVGSVNSDKGDCTTNTPGFDMDHEGHSGWLSIMIADDYLQDWLALSKPDIVQYMVGTNDVFYNHTMDEIIDSYTRMVDLMRHSNPRMQIIVDKLVPLAVNNTAVQQLNARIPGWVDSMNTTESPIYIADCSEDAGFTMDMLRDGIHPNEEGDIFMAQQIGPLVMHSIDEVIDGR